MALTTTKTILIVSLDSFMHKNWTVNLAWFPPRSLISQPHIIQNTELKTPAVYVLQDAHQPEESRDLAFLFY